MKRKSTQIYLFKHQGNYFAFKERQTAKLIYDLFHPATEPNAKFEFKNWLSYRVDAENSGPPIKVNKRASDLEKAMIGFEAVKQQDKASHQEQKQSYAEEEYKDDLKLDKGMITIEKLLENLADPKSEQRKRALKLKVREAKNEIYGILQFSTANMAQLKTAKDLLLNKNREELQKATEEDKMSIKQIFDTPLYRNAKLAMVPFKNMRFKVEIATNDVSACMIHALNESLQGYFFLSLDDLITAFNRVKQRSGLDLAANFTRKQGFPPPVRTPLIKIRLFECNEWLALHEIAEPKHRKTIQHWYAYPMTFYAWVAAQGVNTIIVKAESLEISNEHFLSHAYVIRWQDDGWVWINPGADPIPFADEARIQE